MKFNFWQVLGLVLVIAGVVLVARSKMSTTDVPPAGNGVGPAPSAATMPADMSADMPAAATTPTTDPAPAP